MIQPRIGKQAWLHHARTIPASARVMGLYLVASRGSGKSRMLGRVIAWQDFLAGIPQVIIDPVGGTIDNFLDKVAHFLQYVPKSQQYRFWQRIRYVDMGSKEFIVPFPLYYRLGTESLLAIAERYLQVILKSNPSLLNAQVYGYPPLHKIGTYAGMALASLNLEITSAENLLRHPEQYLSRLTHAQDRYPELAPVIAFFRDEYLPMRETDRTRLTNPFLDKVFQFALDPYLKAMFGASEPGINLNEVTQRKETVLLDYRGVQGEHRRFLLLWVFSYLSEWIKSRGRSKQPFGLIIDEVATLTQKVFQGENPFAQELDEFINVYMRNSSIWFTAAHQELYQVDEQLRNTLLSLGNYIIGGTSSIESARVLADALFYRDPYWVKHYRPVYGRVLPYNPLAVIAEEPEFMPLLEQRELFAQRIKKLGLFQFLLRPALSEGSIGSAVLPLSIHSVDQGQFPDPAVITRLRSLLAAKSGTPIATLLAEQEARLHSGAIQERLNGAQPPGIALPPGKAYQPIHRRQRIT